MPAFERRGDGNRWRAGIFRGIHGVDRPLGQTSATDEIQQVIRDGVAEGIEQGADLAADKLEERYRPWFGVLFGAIVLTALATTVTAFLVASKDD